MFNAELEWVWTRRQSKQFRNGASSLRRKTGVPLPCKSAWKSAFDCTDEARTTNQRLGNPPTADTTAGGLLSKRWRRIAIIYRTASAPVCCTQAIAILSSGETNSKRASFGGGTDAH